MLGSWQTTFYTCSSECNNPRGAIVQVRDVLVKAKNGGEACGAVTNTSQCPEVDQDVCNFDSLNTVRIKVAATAYVYDKHKERVATVLNNYLRKNVFLGECDIFYFGH